MPVYFLVDFENTVILFYSQVCEQIQQGLIRQIMDSACCLEICKLKKQGKNALDFYIATRVGAVFGTGYGGKLAIVSRDQGYAAVRDYWRCRAVTPREVIPGA